MFKKVSLFIVAILMLVLTVGMLAACNDGDKKIVSIEFADGEWQTNYYLGQLFEPCEATITYDDGTTEVITVTAEMIRGFDTSKIGEYDITIDINGFTKTLTITVGYPPSDAGTDSLLYLWTSYYFVDDDPEVFSAYILDGTQKVRVTRDMVEGFDTSVVGEYVANIRYNGEVISAKYNVVEPVSGVELAPIAAEITDEAMENAVRTLFLEAGAGDDLLATEKNKAEIAYQVATVKPYLEMAGIDTELLNAIVDKIANTENTIVSSFVDIIYSDKDIVDGIFEWLTAENNLEVMLDCASLLLEKADSVGWLGLIYIVVEAFYSNGTSFDSVCVQVPVSADESIYSNNNYGADIDDIMAMFPTDDVEFRESLDAYCTQNALLAIDGVGGKFKPAIDAADNLVNVLLSQSDSATAAADIRQWLKAIMAVENGLDNFNFAEMADSEVSFNDLVAAANSLGNKLAVAMEGFFDPEAIASLAYAIGFFEDREPYLESIEYYAEEIIALAKVAIVALQKLDADTLSDVFYALDAMMKAEDEENQQTETGRLIVAVANLAVEVMDEMTDTEIYTIKNGHLGIERLISYAEEWVVTDADNLSDAELRALSAVFSDIIDAPSSVAAELSGSNRAIIEYNFNYYRVPYLGAGATQEEIEDIFWNKSGFEMTVYGKTGIIHADYEDDFYDNRDHEFKRFLDENGAEYEIKADNLTSGFRTITLTCESFTFDCEVYNSETNEFKQAEITAEAFNATKFVYTPAAAAEYVSDYGNDIVIFGLPYLPSTDEEWATLAEDENFLAAVRLIIPNAVVSTDGKTKLYLPCKRADFLKESIAIDDIAVDITRYGQLADDMFYGFLTCTFDGIVSINIPVVFAPIDPNSHVGYIEREELIVDYSFYAEIDNGGNSNEYVVPETGNSVLDEAFKEMGGFFLNRYDNRISLEKGTLKILKGYQPTFGLSVDMLGTSSVNYNPVVIVAGLDVNKVGTQQITLSETTLGLEKTYTVEVVDPMTVPIGVTPDPWEYAEILTIFQDELAAGTVTEAQIDAAYKGIGFVPIVKDNSGRYIFPSYEGIYDYNTGTYKNYQKPVAVFDPNETLEDSDMEFYVYFAMNSLANMTQRFFSLIGTYSEIVEALGEFGVNVSYDAAEWNTSATNGEELRRLTLTFTRNDKTINTQTFDYAITQKISGVVIDPDNWENTYTYSDFPTGSFFSNAYVTLSDNTLVYISSCDVNYDDEAIGEVEVRIYIRGTLNYVAHKVTILPDDQYISAFGRLENITLSTADTYIEQGDSETCIQVKMEKSIEYNGKKLVKTDLKWIYNGDVFPEYGLVCTIEGLDPNQEYGEYEATLKFLNIDSHEAIYTFVQKYTVTPPNLIIDVLDGFILGIDELMRGAINAEENAYMAADAVLSYDAQNEATGERVSIDATLSFAASYSDAGEDWALFKFSAAGRNLALYFVEYEGIDSVLLGEENYGAYEWYRIGTEDGIAGSFIDRIRNAICALNSDSAEFDLEEGFLSTYEYMEGTTIGQLISLFKLLEGILKPLLFGEIADNHFALEVDACEAIELIESLLPLFGIDTATLIDPMSMFAVLVGYDFDENFDAIKIGDANLVAGFDVNEIGALENFSLQYELLNLNELAGSFQGWSFTLDVAVDNIVLKNQAEEMPYELAAVEVDPALQAQIILPMDGDDATDDVTLEYNVLLATGEMLVTFEQYDDIEKFIYVKDGSVVMDTFFLEYLFGLATNRDPAKNYIVEIYSVAMAPMNAAGGQFYVVDLATADEIFAAISGAFLTDLTNVDFIVTSIINWLCAFVGEDADMANMEVGEIPLQFLYCAMNVFLDAQEKNITTDSINITVDRDGMSVTPDYRNDPDAPLTEEEFLAFFEKQGWTFDGLDGSIFEKIDSHSISYDSEAGLYVCNIENARVLVGLKLITAEEFHDAYGMII